MSGDKSSDTSSKRKRHSTSYSFSVIQSRVFMCSDIILIKTRIVNRASAE